MICIESIADDTRWPHFRAAALDRQVASSLSVPMTLPSPDTFGGLNLYGGQRRAFDDSDEAKVASFAAEGSVVVANAYAYWTFELTRNLSTAMEHRGVIEQAKDIFMGTQHCSADEAFTMLRRRSQAENRKLRNVAADVVAATHVPCDDG